MSRTGREFIAIAGTMLYTSLPSVDDAPARVQAIISSHGGGTAVRVPPDARVARIPVTSGLLECPCEQAIHWDCRRLAGNQIGVTRADACDMVQSM